MTYDFSILGFLAKLLSIELLLDKYLFSWSSWVEFVSESFVEANGSANSSMTNESLLS